MFNSQRKTDTNVELLIFSAILLVLSCFGVGIATMPSRQEKKRRARELKGAAGGGRAVPGHDPVDDGPPSQPPSTLSATPGPPQTRSPAPSMTVPTSSSGVASTSRPPATTILAQTNTLKVSSLSLNALHISAASGLKTTSTIHHSTQAETTSLRSGTAAIADSRAISAAAAAQKPDEKKTTDGNTKQDPKKDVSAVATKVSQPRDIATNALQLRLENLNFDSGATNFPRKLNLGQEGSEVKLRSNHVKMDSSKIDSIWQYSINIDPAPKSARMRRRILFLLFHNPANEYELSAAATDYRDKVYSTKQLLPQGITKDFQVNYYGEGETGPRTGAEKTMYDVVLDPVWLGAHELKISNANAQNSEPIITALNVFLNRKPYQNTVVKCLGKNTFFNLDKNLYQHRAALNSNLEGLVGIYKSVKVCLGGLLMNANVSASAFYVTKRMDWLIDAWSGSDENYQYRDRVQLNRFIRGLRVQARHGRHRVYTVWGVAKWGPNHWNGQRPTKDVVTFVRKNKTTGKDEKVTIAVYFKEEYPIFHFDYPNDLVLNCGSEKDPRYLPAQCLDILPGNAYTRLLEGPETANMQKLACQRPTENEKRIKQGLELLGIPARNNDSPEYRFGLKVDENLLQITGRMLQSPTLRYSSDKSDVSLGSWNLRGVKFLKPSNSGRTPLWSWVEFTDAGRVSDAYKLDRYVDALRTYIRQYCPELRELDPKRVPHTANFPVNDPNKMRIYLNTSINAGVDVVFVVLQSQDAGKYDLLKRIAETELGIHTICVVRKKNGDLPSKPDQAANILMKVNMRLGGKNVRVSLPQSESAIGAIFDSKTMIVGADVTHPGPGSMQNVDSVAAVVASEDDDFCQYPASFRCQTSKMEMIEELDEMLGERLDHWKLKNGGKLYPNKVVFYRDGVSEGQFQQVLDLEWPQIQSVIHQRYNAIGQIPAKVTLLSVQKRHHTRFFPDPKLSPNLMDKYGNPKPGLVVDDHVTSLTNYDFFLQSHFALLGTARPAHYVVLQDQIGCDVDALQKATYWQCFTFCRSTTSISVHPAARYADLACTRARYADLACTRARSYLREFYVAGNRCGETFDRSQGGNAVGAWDHHTGVHARLRDSMFYI